MFLLQINLTYLGRVIVHVVHPALPRWCDFLDLGRHPVRVVCILNEATLVLVLAVPIFVVAVAEFVFTDTGCELVAETCLLVREPEWLTPKDGPHQTFLAVDCLELWTHHSDGDSPRPHY